MNIDFNTIFNNIIYYLTSPEIQAKIFPAKIAFLSISLVLIVGIIILFAKTHWLQWLFFQDMTEFLTRRVWGAKRVTARWKKISKRLEGATESEYKLAVIEADDMLDASLKRMGYAGQTLAERLQRLTSATLPNIEEVYEAHKTRNSIVHNPDFRLSSDDAKKTIEIYEQAFRDLQILT